MFLKSIRCNKGQALVEIALALPLLIILSLGVLEAGRVIHTYLIVGQAAREGARIASLRADDLEIVTKVKGELFSLGAETAAVHVLPSEVERQPGRSVTVQIDYPLSIYAPVLNGFLPNPFIVQAETTMRIE
ncbi:pilus assembly protein [Metallumcola ferriviriculae]|uniref:Pilus assembly protein n=1 Tax=Metallumcola ferriviriculae TaxID=3039180 RepID=A0AAU0URN7_9FIRM|nr:pilus assembly protein [Desulfitibacteraceae bacterium MK1]